MTPHATSTSTAPTTLPTTGYLRIWDILGDKRRGIPPLLPISRTVWYDGIKAGIYPAPVHPTAGLGGRVAAWRVEDIRILLERLAGNRGQTPQE